MGCYEMTIFALQYCASTKKNEKSWRFRKKTMGLKCLIYSSALKRDARI